MEEEGREDTLATKQSWSVDESLRLVVVAMAMAVAMEVAFASGTRGHDTRERAASEEKQPTTTRSEHHSARARCSSGCRWRQRQTAIARCGLDASLTALAVPRALRRFALLGPLTLQPFSPPLSSSCCHHNRCLFPTNDGLGRTARGPSGLPTFTPLCRDW